MKQKFAFFDYDDTLIHGDSGRALLKYYLKKHPLAVFRLLKVAVAFPLSIIGLVKFQTAKSAWLFPMDNLSDEELNDFYHGHCGDAGSKSDFQKFIHKSLSFLLGFRALL